MASIFDIFAGSAVGIGGVGGLIFGARGAREQQEQLNMEETMAETASAKQSLQRTQRMRQVLAQSTATEAGRGVSVASPSFHAVQRSSFNKFNEDEDAAALNLSFQKMQIESQRKNVRDKEIGGMFGTILRTGTAFATIFKER